jgi:hypothetical protein
VTSYPYQLIDMDSANQVGAYATEGEALCAVAETVKLYGAESEAATSLALVWVRAEVQESRSSKYVPKPRAGLISTGPALVELALSKRADSA